MGWSRGWELGAIKQRNPRVDDFKREDVEVQKERKVQKEAAA